MVAGAQQGSDTPCLASIANKQLLSPLLLFLLPPPPKPSLQESFPGIASFLSLSPTNAIFFLLSSFLVPMCWSL